MINEIGELKELFFFERKYHKEIKEIEQKKHKDNKRL